MFSQMLYGTIVLTFHFYFSFDVELKMQRPPNWKGGIVIIIIIL